MTVSLIVDRGALFACGVDGNAAQGFLNDSLSILYDRANFPIGSAHVVKSWLIDGTDERIFQVDVTIDGKLYTGRTPRVALNKMYKDLPGVLQHGRENGCPFSTAKTQVQIFSRSRKHPLPSSVDISAATGLLPEPPASESRWLGAILDTRLSWRPHVKTWAAKASRIGAHLQRLSGTKRGAPPQPLRTAVQACVVSVATYAAEAWFPGRRRR